GESKETIRRKVQHLSKEKSARGGRQGQERRVDADVMEVVDLLGETDEQTDNSSDEETASRKETVCEENQDLNQESLTAGVNHTFITETSVQPGKEELQQRRRQDKVKQPPAGGAAVNLPPGANQNNSTPSLQFHDPPTATPSQTPTPPLPQPARTSRRTSRVFPKPLLTPSKISHNPPVQINRPRTVPNILSRAKKMPPSFPCTKRVEEGSAAGQAAVTLLVGTVLPGQQELRLNPVMLTQTVPQTPPPPGVTSVTLNVPSQQIHLTSVPLPLCSQIYSSSAPLPDFTALQQQEAPPPLGFSTRPNQSQTSDQTKDVDQLLSETPVLRAGPASGPPSSPSTSRSDGQATEEAFPKPESQEKVKEDAEKDNLTSLLNEIVFLNQQICTPPGIRPARNLSSDARQQEAEPGQTSSPHLNDLFVDSPLGEEPSSADGAEERGHAQSPWLLELDEDSSENSDGEAENEGEELNACTEEIRSQPGSSASTSQLQNPLYAAKGSILAPPPLLQMKVGGVKVVEPSSNDRAGGDGGGGGKDGSVAWRPMPRLVPLGLRGNPPS
ncbi:hypothetical protein LDENG_00256190, partial [Lucifuga dentata]